MTPPPFHDGAAIAGATPWPDLISAIEQALLRETAAPLRQNHRLSTGPAGDSRLLIMPAWECGGQIGVKLVKSSPANGESGLPMLSSIYILLDETNGALLGLFEGETLTARRTAAASVLAARHLARADSSRLLVIGAGRQAEAMAAAYASLFPLRHIAVWARRPDQAARLARVIAAETGVVTAPEDDLGAAVGAADIISCATPATTPLLHGRWLVPGTHVDLVGGFTPQMREADDDVVRRALVHVDSREAALVEAGDIIQPLKSGALTEAAILGDLAGLCRGAVPGRLRTEDITLFKSVGLAVEDLAAAALVHSRLAPQYPEQE